MALGRQCSSQPTCSAQCQLRESTSQPRCQTHSNTCHGWRWRRWRLDIFTIPSYACVHSRVEIGHLLIINFTEAGNYAAEIFRQGKDYTAGAAGSLFDSAKDIFGQTSNGWEKTKESFEVPAWMHELFRKYGGEENHGGPGPDPPRQSRGGGAAAVGTGAAFGYTQSPEYDEQTGEQTARDDQMMILT